ncbi:IctB family putative bicarbonate transporter [soil metagenome]
MAIKLSKWFFLTLIVSLPLVRPFNTTILGLQVPFTDFIFVLSFGFWLLAVIRRETTIRTNRIFAFVGLYATAFAISTVFSSDPTRSLYKLLGEFYLFSLCFLTFNLATNNEFLKKIAIAWLVGTGLTILAAATGFILFYLGFKTQDDNFFLSHRGSLPAGDYPRIYALFDNPNMLCNFLTVSIVLVVMSERLGWIKKKVAITLALGVVLTAVFSLSPGIGGIFLGLSLWFWALEKGRRSMFAKIALSFGLFMAITAFASAVVSPDTRNTIQDIELRFVHTRIEASVRVLAWEDTLRQFRENPWLGIGTGLRVADIRYTTLTGENLALTDGHNMWLNVLGQTGITGLAALMLLLIYLVKLCKFKVLSNGESGIILVGMSCAFVAAFVYEGLTGSFEDARHLWVLVGMLTAASSKC